MQEPWIADLLSTLALAALLSGFSPFVFGGAVTDGSVGPARSFSGSGDSFTVPEAVGTLKGSNLFHSFARFSVAAGEAAKFTTTTSSIRNVISRVTGGEPSLIHGLLALEAASGSRPDFYFVNPSGVIFGAGAQVNVPAGLHVSTAQQLKFEDGFVWTTTAPTGSSLSVAPIAAFGFVSPPPSPVTFHNLDASGIPGMGPTIQLAPNSTLSISGGTVQFNSAGLSVPEGGQIKIEAQGEVAILNGSFISSVASSDKAAGSIDVKAASLVINRGQSKDATGILSKTAGAGAPAGGQIKIAAEGKVSILNGSSILSVTSSDKAAGSIDVRAASLLIDREESRNATGILSSTTGTGDAGQITIDLKKKLSIRGGEISSETTSAGSAGQMEIKAGAMSIDGRGSARGIFNDAGKDSVGAANSGRVRIKVAGELSLFDGGQISSSTFSEKPAGSVDVGAGALKIDAQGQAQSTGIFSIAGRGSNANAGSITVDVADHVSILAGAEISSDSRSGATGTINIKADSLTVSGFRFSEGILPSRIASVAREGSGDRGSITVKVDNHLAILDGAEISSDSHSGATGAINIEADSLEVSGFVRRGGDTLRSRIASVAREGSFGERGAITVNVDKHVSILDGAEISSDSQSGAGGTINIEADSLTVSGLSLGRNVLRSRIASVAREGSVGGGGAIAVNVQDDVSILDGAEISSDSNSGAAGTISIEADSLTVSGFRNLSREDIRASRITSVAGEGSFGGGGAIRIDVERLSLREQGQITSTTMGQGDAGHVQITVADELRIEGAGISSRTTSTASAGQIDIEAGVMTIDGGGSVFGINNDAGRTSAGETNFGRVRVEVAGQLSIVAGGQISSSTSSRNGKPAGSVDIEAGTLVLDGRQQGRATGVFSVTVRESNANAGRITVNVSDQLSIRNGAEISTTSRSGAAGTIEVHAPSLEISGSQTLRTTGGHQPSWIASRAREGAFGDGGRIEIDVERLSILQGGQITTTTESLGSAGEIHVEARSVEIDDRHSGMNTGIFSEAAPSSSGQPGSVSIATDRLEVRDAGHISIANEATVSNASEVTPTTLAVSAGSIFLSGDGEITAASKGSIAASGIDVKFSDLLVLRNARITTSAADGNGGEIRIRGGRGILLDQSQVTTSVTGTRNGNGGDITINAGALALDTGFVQANTNAIRAVGGNVFVDIEALLPSGGTLALGGNDLSFRPEVFALNVIQAAAPDGVSGRVEVAVPSLDIAGSLAGLRTELIDQGPLGWDLCRLGEGSSLTPLGPGGLRPTDSALIRPERGYVLRVVGNEDGIGLETKEAADPAGIRLAWACY